MKAKAVIIVLVIVCLALGAGIFFYNNKHADEIKNAETRQTTLSNNWVNVKAQLTEREIELSDLRTNFSVLSETLTKTSNELVVVKTTLTKTEADAKAAAQTAQQELEKRDKRITELEGERDDLTKRMTELNASIVGLEKQIAETEKKLANSEGSRDFLLKELQRLQKEKAELEKQFNNLAFVREQVRKLRDELSIAKRLEWIRRGLYGSSNVKGAERLNQGFKESSTPPATNFNLNVELRSDGSVKTNPTTNAPAANK